MNFVAMAGLMLTSSAVGARLIGIARRTRGLPEAFIGASCLIGGALGYPLAVAGALLDDGPLTLTTAFLQIAGGWSLGAGIALCIVFSTILFHPAAEWAKLVAALGVATAVAASVDWTWCVLATRDAESLWRASLPSKIGMGILHGAAYTWLGLEGLHRSFTLRRRARAGLADPVLENRFLIWGLSALACAAWSGVTVRAIVAGQSVVADPALIVGTCLLGVFSSSAMMLSFAPPRWYLRWLLARSGAAAVA